MDRHAVPAFTAMHALAAVVIALISMLLSSLVKEPERQKLSAIILAGAGAAYLNGGLGGWELPFCALMTFMAYKGLTHYLFLGVGWVFHTVWDIVHHMYANSIVSFSPSSAAGCAVCDAILALRFFLQAPSVFDWFRKRLLLDSRGVDLTKAYDAIFTSRYLLEAIIFQGPYQGFARFRRTFEHKTLESNKSLIGL